MQKYNSTYVDSLAEKTAIQINNNTIKSLIFFSFIKTNAFASKRKFDSPFSLKFIFLQKSMKPQIHEYISEVDKKSK
jgi:hypothetical protein